MGYHGISLVPIHLKDAVIKDNQIIGGFKHDGKKIIGEYTSILLLDATARAIGAAKTLVEDVFDYVKNRKRNNVEGELSQMSIVKLRLGEIMTKFIAMQALNQQAHDKYIEGTLSLSEMQANKAFSANCLIDITNQVQLLFGA